MLNASFLLVISGYIITYAVEQQSITEIEIISCNYEVICNVILVYLNDLT